MAKNTSPVFIIGSGRSGTRTFFRMLTGAPGLEIHHEYAVLETQKLAALYFMGLIDKDTAKKAILERHGAAVHYSKSDIWADSSNKLTWLIDPLSELFPAARFLAIVRDGRKVVPSFYYKLREEMYDDESTQTLAAWLSNRLDPMPPAEKRYWWNIPQPGQIFHQEFSKFNRLQRVAYHWSESNRAIMESFEKLPSNRTLLVRLEDLTKDKIQLQSTLQFIGIPYDETYFEYLKTPRNVFIPLDFQLTKNQKLQFESICAPIMNRLGYTTKETYSVKY